MPNVIPYKSFCWSLGTTSFRTKDFNKTIEEQLSLLDEFWKLEENKSKSWSGNKDLQTRYYDFMQSKDFVEGNAGNKPKDAREKTSGLVDIGLIDDGRKLSNAGKALLKITSENDFSSDNQFQIAKDSYIYLKQLLKTYYNVDGHTVRPFIVLIHLLNNFDYLTLDEYTYLLPLCIGETETNEIIDGISKLRCRNIADEKYKAWYNAVIPNSIKSEATLSKVEKSACSRASLHMDINNTPTLSQSIGQDNLGNIISALVDIYILSLDDEYNGALLCVDEIDVSLHPDTQIRLLDLFVQLSEELNIQFVLSTHSLTILKETLKKEKKDSTNFKVVYLKNPSAPYVTDRKTYELLKSDMFGSLSFLRPKVKIYFEDEIGKNLFELLMVAFDNIYNIIEKEGDVENPVLRNSSDVRDFAEINDRIHSLGGMLHFLDNTRQISTMLGCEELFKINNADEYFKRVIFILDGDARYKDPTQKPKIKDYLEQKYDQHKLLLNDRNHPQNICFLPDYFAPESFLYSIIYKISTKPMEHLSFWRGLDSNETTALYTSEKIISMFSNLTDEYNNDDLKKILTNSRDNEVWQFVKKSDIITYYYSDYKTVEELLTFLEKIKKAYDMTLPLTLSNRYS